MPKESDYPEILRLAFRDALHALIAKGEQNVRPRDLVLHVLSEAMCTMKALPDPEAAWIYSMRSVWPEVVHTREDRLDAYYAELLAIEQGKCGSDSLLRKAPPSPSAVLRMYVVFEVFPTFLIGTNRRRDYQIICGVASNTEGKALARKLGLHKNSVYERRDAQLLAIAKRLSAVLPGPEQIAAAYDDHERRVAGMTANFHAGHPCSTVLTDK